MSTSLQRGVVSSGEGVLEECCSFCSQRCWQGSSPALPGRAVFLSTGSTNVLCSGRKLSVTEDKAQPRQHQHHLTSSKTKAPQKNEITTKGCFFILFPNPRLDCWVPPSSPSSPDTPACQPCAGLTVFTLPPFQKAVRQKEQGLRICHARSSKQTSSSVCQVCWCTGDGIWIISMLITFLQRH